MMSTVSIASLLPLIVVGPFVGGILVAHVSMTAAFAVNAVSYVASVVSLLFVAHREPVRQLKKLDGKQFVAELREGPVFIGSMPLMRTLIPVALVANFLLAPFELVLIQYCTTVLHGDAQLFGALGACWSGGMLAGAVAAGALAKKIRKGILISVCFPVFTLVLLAMALTSITWVALSLAAIGGLFNMVVNILVMTIIPAAVPQEKMGRVFGSFTLLLQGAQPFAQALAGYLLIVFSVPVLMAILAILTTIDAFVAAASKVVRSQE